LFSRFLKLGFIWDRSPSLPRYFTRAYDGMLFDNTDSLQEESQRSVIKN